MFEVSIVLASEHGSSGADRWFLTQEEFDQVYVLLAPEDAQNLPRRPVSDSRMCPVCLDNMIEKRLPKCNVSDR